MEGSNVRHVTEPKQACVLGCSIVLWQQYNSCAGCIIHVGKTHWQVDIWIYQSLGNQMHYVLSGDHRDVWPPLMTTEYLVTATWQLG